MRHIKSNFISRILNSGNETHVRISAEGRKVIDNRKLSSEMVKTLIANKEQFIEGKPIKVGANGSTISVTQVSDSIKIDK